MSFPRIVAQIVFAGAQAVTRATVEASRQVMRNAQAQEGAAAAGGASSKQDSVSRQHNMTFDEACNILNAKNLDVKNDESLSHMIKTYEHLFSANDPKAGSSFYLQSKVVRAKERIEAELGLQGHPAFQAKDKPGQSVPSSQQNRENQENQQNPKDS